jgi:hypothetical protein
LQEEAEVQVQHQVLAEQVDAEVFVEAEVAEAMAQEPEE